MFSRRTKVRSEVRGTVLSVKEGAARTRVSVWDIESGETKYFIMHKAKVKVGQYVKRGTHLGWPAHD